MTSNARNSFKCCFVFPLEFKYQKKNETRSSDLRSSSGVENYNKQRCSQNILKLKMSTHKNSEIMWESERPVWLWTCLFYCRNVKKSSTVGGGRSSNGTYYGVVCKCTTHNTTGRISGRYAIVPFSTSKFSHFLQRWCAACAMVFEMHASAVTCQTYKPTPIQEKLFRVQLYPNVI